MPICDPAVSDALRYLGARENAPEELVSETEEMMAALRNAAAPKHTFRIFSLEKREDEFLLAGTGTSLIGRSAATMLQDCSKAAVFACTLGFAAEKLYRTWEKRDMAAALILDACGSALIEQVCDSLSKEIGERLPQLYATDRFSPGYGDLPLSVQKSLFSLLDAERLTGIHLNDACLMTPQKSVTAVIGFSERPQPARIRGCAYCTMKDHCLLRRGGKRCGTIPE